MKPATILINASVVLTLSTTNLLACPFQVVAINATDPLALGEGLRTCRVHVRDTEGFFPPLISVYQANIVTNDPQGFYQHPIGSSLPPNPEYCALFPLLCSDSWVTIGTEVPNAYVALDPDFNSLAFNAHGYLQGGWYNSYPGNGLGTPDLVLIAQFTVGASFDVWGTFWTFASCAVPLELSFTCPPACPADLDGNSIVDATDLAQLLGAWGANPGHPADFNGDASVNAADLAQLLGAWGPCG